MAKFGCTNHEHKDCPCCMALASLAHAANSVQQHAACCDDQAGKDCCSSSLASVLDAMQCHLDHLRGACCAKKA